VLNCTVAKPEQSMAQQLCFYDVLGVARHVVGLMHQLLIMLAHALADTMLHRLCPVPRLQERR
jgi:hypothetical protein